MSTEPVSLAARLVDASLLADDTLIRVSRSLLVWPPAGPPKIEPIKPPLALNDEDEDDCLLIAPLSAFRIFSLALKSKSTEAWTRPRSTTSRETPIRMVSRRSARC